MLARDQRNLVRDSQHHVITVLMCNIEVRLDLIGLQLGRPSFDLDKRRPGRPRPSHPDQAIRSDKAIAKVKRNLHERPDQPGRCSKLTRNCAAERTNRPDDREKSGAATTLLLGLTFDALHRYRPCPLPPAFVRHLALLVSSRDTALGPR